MAALTLLASSSCGARDAAADSIDAEGPAPEAAAVVPPEPGSDLWVFELRGPVKECVSTTYYKVAFNEDDGSAQPDTSAINTHTRRLYFDREGNYVAASHERIRRDSQGRIVSWRDARPNNKGTHPGVLADTLAYTWIDANVLRSSGMGDLALTVYDDNGNIVGQYSRPDADGARMSAFNITRATDPAGNWTDRLTVWVSSSGLTAPHVTYTLEHRDITYRRLQ